MWWGRQVITRLDALTAAVNTLTQKVIHMGTTLDTDIAAIQASVDTMAAAVAASATEFKALSDKIAALIAGGTVSQTQLDELVAIKTALDTQTAALVAATPPPPAP